MAATLPGTMSLASQAGRSREYLGKRCSFISEEIYSGSSLDVSYALFTRTGPCSHSGCKGGWKIEHLAKGKKNHDLSLGAWHIEA